MLTSLVMLVGGLLLHASTPSDAQSESNVVYNHDCIVGSPPICNRSLADDPTCKGLNTNSITGWQTNDYDYVIYDVKAPVVSNKYIVIHAGRCDIDTEFLGDYLYEVTGYNLFGLRPATGLNTQTCIYDRSVCDALHLSWTAWNGVPGAVGALGLGFNPPALVEYAKDPSNSFLFLHTYDGLPDYPWAGACNQTKPAYVCIQSAEDEDSFDRKFYGADGTAGVKDLLETFSNSEYIPCTVEVIDARNSSITPGIDFGTVPGEKPLAINRYADLPCSGIYPQVNTQGFLIEMQDTIAQGLYTAILRTQDGTGNSTILDAFAQAIQIALGD